MDLLKGHNGLIIIFAKQNQKNTIWLLIFVLRTLLAGWRSSTLNTHIYICVRASLHLYLKARSLCLEITEKLCRMFVIYEGSRGEKVRND